MYLLDSDFCIDFMRGRKPAELLLRALPASEVAVAAISCAELHYGARRAADLDQELEKLRRFLEPLRLVPFTPAAAEHYGRLRLDLERRGEVIGRHDMLIAATALAHDATLVTRNTREFRRVIGLRVRSWQE